MERPCQWSLSASALPASTKRRRQISSSSLVTNSANLSPHDASQIATSSKSESPALDCGHTAKYDGRTAAFDFVEYFPTALSLKIFSLVPARVLASRCTLVQKSWAALVSCPSIWRDFCTPWNLIHSDTKEVLGGWRGLYASVFGTNLVQSPHFERLHLSDCVDEDTCEQARPFEARAMMVLEAIGKEGEPEPEYRFKSHWDDDVDGVTLLSRAANAVVRTLVSSRQGGTRKKDGVTLRSPADVALDQTTPHTDSSSSASILPVSLPPEGEEALRTSGSQWGRVKQTISLEAFPKRFLDRCPPLHLSALCAKNKISSSACAQLQLEFCSSDGTILHSWGSGAVTILSRGWFSISSNVKCPLGVGELRLKVAGLGVDFTRVQLMFQSS